MTSVPRNPQVFTYTPAERHALRQLRRRYQRKEEVWSSGELARLRFVRWLYLTRRLLPWTEDGEKHTERKQCDQGARHGL